MVAVMGARQVGKSTLVRRLPALRGHLYLSLDDLDLRLQAQADPRALLGRGERLILDEVQRVPELLLAIKRSVDEARVPGRFVLTSSAHLLHAHLAETLAGRAAHLVLWPMTRREQRGLGRAGPWGELLAASVEAWLSLLRKGEAEREDWRLAVARGGFTAPALHLEDREERQLWFRGHLQTYPERDVPVLWAVENLPELRKLMEALALRSGSLLNQSELARDLGISQPTVHRYLNLLEVSFLLVRLRAYARSRTKRLVKSPKIYLPDPALALSLTGGKPSGATWRPWPSWTCWPHAQGKPPGLYYRRTASGQEVDFVPEAEEKLLPVEVKATSRPTPKDAQGLLAFLAEYPEVPGRLLLHGGEEVFPLADRVVAAPWWRVA